MSGTKNNDDERREILAQKLNDEMGEYALKGRNSRKRTAALNCVLKFGEANNLAEKIEIFNQEYGRAEGVEDFDQLSRLGFAIGEQRSRASDMDKYNWIFKKIYSYNAPIILVGGQLGKGKTDVALYSVENGIRYNEVEKFAGNIKSVDVSDLENKTGKEIDYQHISNWEEFNDWMEKDRKSKVFIHDEATQNLDKRRGMNQLVIEYTHKNELMRKHNAKVILIAPDPYELDKRLTKSKLTNVILEKQTKKSLQVEAIANLTLRRILPENPIVYNNVPRTIFDFDTHEVAEFKVSEGEGSEDPILEKHVRIYQDYQDEGTSQRDLADKYDMSKSGIKHAIDRVKEALEND